MVKPKKGRRIGGSPSHQKAILSNLAIALLEHNRIKTTHTKAKALKPFVDKLIGLGKKDDLNSKRRALAILRHNRKAVIKLFDEVAPRYHQKDSGYTRIIKIGNRYGDAAPMVFIELI